MSTKSKVKKRVVNKPLNRQRLIQATLDTIVESGIENASVSRILANAKLSRGMINLHFESKQTLLLEALKYYTDIYNQNWYTRLDSVLDRKPAQIMQTMIESDLDARLLNEKYVVIWYEFRGKARTNKIYRQYTDTRYSRYRQTYYSVCAELVKAENLNSRLTRYVAHGLISIMEGMWVDYYLHSDSFSRNSAKKALFIHLAALFPSQFNHKGAV